MFFSFFFSTRNHSNLKVKACTKWLLTNESLFSDAAILEIQLPTGYSQSKQSVDEYVKRSKITNLKFGLIQARQAVFVFDHVYPRRTCVRFQVDRWHPVANSSAHLLARIYESNRPGTSVLIQLHFSQVIAICDLRLATNSCHSVSNLRTF